MVLFYVVCKTYGNIVEIVFLGKIYCHSMKKYIIDMFFIITMYRTILLERNRSEIIKDVHSVTHDYGLKCNLIHWKITVFAEWMKNDELLWYECQLDNSPSKSQFIKVNHYRSRYGLQHGALAQTEQQAIKGSKKNTSVKPFKRKTTN